MKGEKKVCPHCNEEFISNHARRVYCCDSHRVAAYNKRKGYKVAVIPPEEDKGLKSPKNDLKAINPEHLKPVKRNDFNYQNIGAVATGTLLAKAIQSIFTAEDKKPATKEYVLRLIGEHHQEMTRQNKAILDELRKRNISMLL